MANNIPRPTKNSEPIVTTSLSKSSLNSSSTLSVSPSTSVLLSRVRYRSSKTPSIPQTCVSSSSSSTTDAKLEQIIQNFYTKTAQIIVQSRISSEVLKGDYNSRRKINKWFNITTNDYENLREELKFWKSFMKNHKDQEPPPLIIDIYLETTEPDLLQEGDNVRGWHKLELGVQRILVESWTLILNSFSLSKKDEPLTNIDTTQVYEFKEVVTPLGTFKLKLSYRKYCQFDTREGDAAILPSSLPNGIDVEENFFTPTMTKYRQETVSRPPTPIFPSSSSSSSSRSRIQSFRSTASRSPYPTASTSTTTSFERRTSAPLVQPFKSPSLSSSPQKEPMYPSSRSQTPEKLRPESGSFGRKIEFSSSFEKFKNLSGSRNSYAPDLARRGSRTSDHSSIYLESEEEEEDLEDFMKFIGTRQELKLFKQYNSVYSEKEVTQQQEDVRL
ncbi:autophagy-related protein 13-domain-containing protein [Thamnidium elegans]|nr:autophagy-related protein 13-domain-containing protein [Thamnidium elegans]